MELDQTHFDATLMELETDLELDQPNEEITDKAPGRRVPSEAHTIRFSNLTPINEQFAATDMQM
ncbi:hypothetical protein J6590_030539 [Homalodisca vitripennis]|nr:hypothetical protein J6590_030539 [Homalodisca vitripennis]